MLFPKACCSSRAQLGWHDGGDAGGVRLRLAGMWICRRLQADEHVVVVCVTQHNISYRSVRYTCSCREA